MEHLQPVNYHIRLKPDLVDFTFSGSVDILFEAVQPIETVKLNILDMAVWGCTVRHNGNLAACLFQVDPKKEELSIFLPRPMCPPILVFIGVGKFEFVFDDEDRRVRAITLPGMNSYARFGLEFGRKSLGFSEAYYGIPYPISKLDLIAIPDFAFGAMENWGAITFRENLLLHYPDVTSKSGEQRICEVIAHEIAHQWFGNLVTPCDYKANDLQTGFYIVKYNDQNDRKRLKERVQNKSLPAEDRWGLQNDLFFLCKNGEASLNDYLEFLACYENEDAFLPLMSISSHLMQAYLAVDNACKSKIEAFAGPWFENVLQGIGCEPAPDEKQTTSIMRDQLIWQTVLYGSEAVADFACGQFEKLMRGEKIHPDIVKSVMQVGSFAKGEKAFEWLDGRFHSAESEHERMNILIALGGFRDGSQIEKSQQYVLDAVPPRNKFVPVAAMAANPYAIPLLWDWYVSNLDQIEQFHPMMYE